MSVFAFFFYDPARDLALFPFEHSFVVPTRSLAANLRRLFPLGFSLYFPLDMVRPTPLCFLHNPIPVVFLFLDVHIALILFCVDGNPPFPPFVFLPSANRPPFFFLKETVLFLPFKEPLCAVSGLLFFFHLCGALTAFY